MVCKERGSAWDWASKMVLKRSFSVAAARCCQVSGLGRWLGSDFEGRCAAMKTSTPNHVKRGEKFKMFPDALLLHLLFPSESEKCLLQLVALSTVHCVVLCNSLCGVQKEIEAAAQEKENVIVGG